mmetsp:Transcript_10482/g.45541  ORF Transcript_10482/g.45541 Transcript_10482/m.45541 type:complete len:219 (+) Transcript_10482:452-1108(+)
MCCSTHLSRTWLGQQRHIFHREPCDYQRAGHSHVDTRCFRLLWTSLDCLHSLVLLYRLPHVATVAPTGVQPPQPVQASRGSDTLGASTHLQAMHWQLQLFVGTNIQQASAVLKHQPYAISLAVVGPPLCCAVDPRDYFLSLWVHTPRGGRRRILVLPRNLLVKNAGIYIGHGRRVVLCAFPKKLHRRPRIRSNSGSAMDWLCHSRWIIPDTSQTIKEP